MPQEITAMRCIQKIIKEEVDREWKNKTPGELEETRKRRWMLAYIFTVNGPAQSFTPIFATLMR